MLHCFKRETPLAHPDLGSRSPDPEQFFHKVWASLLLVQGSRHSVIRTLPELHPLLHPAYLSPSSPVSHTIYSGATESETKSQGVSPLRKGTKGGPELVHSSDGIPLGGNQEGLMPWEWGMFPMETPVLLSGKSSVIRSHMHCDHWT